MKNLVLALSFLFVSQVFARDIYCFDQDRDIEFLSIGNKGAVIQDGYLVSILFGKISGYVFDHKPDLYLSHSRYRSNDYDYAKYSISYYSIRLKSITGNEASLKKKIYEGSEFKELQFVAGLNCSDFTPEDLEEWVRTRLNWEY